MRIPSFTPPPAGDAVAEHDLLAVCRVCAVRRRIPASGRPRDGPAGEARGDLHDVLLRVAAVDAERVQLHQLARVVLVEALLAPPERAREQAPPGAGGDAESQLSR